MSPSPYPPSIHPTNIIPHSPILTPPPLLPSVKPSRQNSSVPSYPAISTSCARPSPTKFPRPSCTYSLITARTLCRIGLYPSYTKRTCLGICYTRTMGLRRRERSVKSCWLPIRRRRRLLGRSCRAGSGGGVSQCLRSGTALNSVLILRSVWTWTFTSCSGHIVSLYDVTHGWPSLRARGPASQV